MGNTTKQDKAYLTVEQIADILLIHWQTVLDYIRTGQLPAVKLNKGYRIARADLDNFLRQKTTGKSDFNVVRIKERISDILALTELKDQRTITLSASLLPKPVIDDLFEDDGESSYAGLLRNPPTTRRMGWGFKSSQNDPKPVLGQCLELKIGRGVAVRIFKDGHVIATGSASSNYLGWAVNKDAVGNMVEGDNINALAAAEFMYNFSWLLYEVLKRQKSKPTSMTFHINIGNPSRGKMINQLVSRGWPVPEIYGDPVQEKEIFVERELPLIATTETDELAACLWKEYSHIFGLLDNRVEYLDENKAKFDKRVFEVQ